MRDVWDNRRLAGQGSWDETRKPIRSSFWAVPKINTLPRSDRFTLGAESQMGAESLSVCGQQPERYPWDLDGAHPRNGAASKEGQ